MLKNLRVYPEVKGKPVKSVKQKRDVFGFVFEKYSGYSIEKELEGQNWRYRDQYDGCDHTPRKENKNLNSGTGSKNVAKQTHLRNVRNQNDLNRLKVSDRGEREVKDACWMPTGWSAYGDNRILHCVLWTECVFPQIHMLGS